MRVISMVPSWTETLVEAGVEVVGRTRFCIHPAERMKAIPVVGGTKDINWEKVEKLNCDILILDKEENPKQIADEALAKEKSKIFATHITNCTDVANEISKLAEELKSRELLEISKKWERVLAARAAQKKSRSKLIQLHHVDDHEVKKFGIQTWIQKPESDYSSVIYVIWKKPFMAITKETFIGSMLELTGIPTHLSKVQTGTSYPEINLEQFDPQKTLFLFSSEPFPFHKKLNEIKALNISSAIVDGESFSWFGVRALKFLEDQLK